VAIDIDAAALGIKAKPTFTEIVSETEIDVSESLKGWTLSLPMEENTTRVIKIE
jgi:hypothetical protein